MSDATQSSQSNPPKRPGKKSRWRVWACASAGTLLALAGAGYWLAATESGLRFGLYQVPSWFGVKIESESLRGTLLGGFEGDNWRIETQGADVNISRFVFDWKPSELWQPSLHITEISAGDIAIVPKPVPPKPEREPVKLPDSIDLPVPVYIDKLQTGKISVGISFAKQTVYLESLQTAYRYDGRGHRLDVHSLKSPWSESTGALMVGLEKPYVLNTAVYTKGELEGEAVHSTTRLWGSLQDVHADLILDGKQVNLTASSVLHPFEPQLNEAVGEILVKGKNINPAAFLPTLPIAKLNFDAVVVPSFTEGIALDGALDLGNEAAGFASKNHIPVRTVISEFTINNNGLINISSAELDLLAGGKINASGSVDTVGERLDLSAQVQNVGMADAVEETIKGRLNGTVAVKGATGAPNISWKLDSGFARSIGLLSISADAALGQRTLKFQDVKLQSGEGELAAEGYLELFNRRTLKLDITSRAFNPALLNAQLPAGSVNGKIALAGELANETFGGKMQFTPSTLNGVALSGNADILYDNRRLPRAHTDIRLGQNIVKTDGSFGRKGDRLNLNINAPDLARFGFGLSGLLTAKGYVAGEFSDGLKNLEADVVGQARAFRVAGAAAAQTLDFRLKGSPDVGKPLLAEVKGEQILLGGASPTVVDAVDLAINGTGLRHRIQGSGAMAAGGQKYRLAIDADGGLSADKKQWKGLLNALDIGGAFNLKLQNRVALEAGSERVQLGAARWAAMGGSLNLQNFVWDKKLGITSKGSADNLHLAELHHFYKPPVPHNLVLGGDWDMSYSENMRGHLNLLRQGGDVVLNVEGKPPQNLGLGALALRSRFQNGRIDAQLEGTTRFGRLNASADIGQQFGGDITQAPLNGRIAADLPNLDALRVYLPPSAQNLSGRASVNAQIGGRVANPTVNSTLNLATNYGRGEGTFTIGPSSRFEDAPLGGRINLYVDNLETFRPFLPVGQTLQGNLHAAAAIGGRLSTPELNGTLNGNNLFYRHQAQGIVLDNGVLRSRLQGRRWLIDSLKFHRGGTVELKGQVSLDKNEPDVDVDVVFDRYRTLSRPNRRLQLSGRTKLLYRPAQGVTLTGGLKADFGMFGFQNSGMPVLDDDVVVVGEAHKEQAESTPIHMDLDLDLNDNVRFVSDGIDVTLGGTLNLRARPKEAVQGVGTVKVVKGRYKAYGQDLEITKGTISFVGPLANPNLNIRAARRLSPVGAGVEVLGNVHTPRVTLVADEPMSEKDKLSWLILNRASSGSDGDEAALSAAAGALLAGQINDRIGLVDDFGFTSKRSRNAQTGELNPAEQVLTVGKQLTNEIYIGYEYGISSAEQTVKAVYQLSRGFQAITRVGSRSWGAELKHVIRFDNWFKKAEPEDVERKP